MGIHIILLFTFHITEKSHIMEVLIVYADKPRVMDNSKIFMYS